MSDVHIEADTTIDALQKRITTAWNEGTADRGAVETVLWHLDRGSLRVATPPETPSGDWTTHPWITQAILLYFRYAEMAVHELGPYEFHDKIPLKRKSRN